MDFNEKLRIYAKTLVKVGANVEKGQLVVIRALTEMKDFVYILTEEAYKLGAGEVKVYWRDDELLKLKYKYEDIETIKNVRSHMSLEHDQYIEDNAVFLSLIGGNPNALEGLDVEKIKAGTIATSKALVNFKKALMSDKNSWVVIGVPTVGWAKTLFPSLSDEEALSKLWELIFYVTRIDETAVENWKKHIDKLKNKAKELNSYKFKYLKYSSDNGTDLTIELPEKHLWMAANSTNSKGRDFVANMPTEEVYTLAHKDGVNGVVYSSKALNYNGNIIDEFKLEFKDGKVVNYSAKKGEEVLKTLLESDEGALSLGEVALVPHDSPISNTNVMFYETLYDENASCHLALGAAYPTCIENGTSLSKEELSNLGVNDSLIHVDFMIGNASLNILGITKDGKEIPVFINGNWAN